MLDLSNDYLMGCHPKILSRLVAVNLEPSPGYGTDEETEAARTAIRAAFGCPQAAVEFLMGGTQTNAFVAAALLRISEGIISADTGHIATHEAGAIEAGGHKVLTIANHDGKIDAGDLEDYLMRWESDLNHDHTVMPRMVYLSQPTEFGTIYSLDELTRISDICHRHALLLYMDGARLAYAVASRESDVPLESYAQLTDVFYVGGTKCGALFGEALVIPDASLCPRLSSLMKAEGALIAKGRTLGLQFRVLFEDGLYQEVGVSALEAADLIRQAFLSAGIELAVESPTNQLFPILDDCVAERLLDVLKMSFWERIDESRCVYRLATSWATTLGEARQASAIIERLGQ